MLEKEKHTVSLFAKRSPIMAQAEVKRQMGIEEEEEEEEEVKWLKHYSSKHHILLVGEGDFSFSLSLALSFGSASNIVASSLDSYDVVIKKYKKAKSNLEILQKLGASILHGVDATRMKLHPDLQMRKFNRIVFNFPHAGFYGKEDNLLLIEMHRTLVQGFFRNANGMLKADGEIHVNHKTSSPFCDWKIEELAWRNSLVLIECVDFKIEDYPGYNNKRGDGTKCDMPFRLGQCSTYKFKILSNAKKKHRVRSRHSGLTSKRSLQLGGNPNQMQCQPTQIQHGHAQTGFTMNMNVFAEYRQSPVEVNIRREIDLVTNGGAVNTVNYFGHEVCGYDFERDAAKPPGRLLQLDRGIPIQMQCHPTSFHHGHLQASFNINDFEEYRRSALAMSIRREFGLVTNGRAVNNVNYFDHKACRYDFEKHVVDAIGRPLQLDPGNLIRMQCQPTSSHHGRARTSFTLNMNDFKEYRRSPLAINVRREIDLVTNGRAVNNANHFVHEAYTHDIERDVVEMPGRTLYGNTYALGEFQSSYSMSGLHRSLVLRYGQQMERTRWSG